MLRTVKLKLSQENLNELLPTLRACQALYNDYTAWAKEKQTWNKTAAHKELYSTLRGSYPSIPSALIQTVRDNALESCKQCKLKARPIKKTLSVRYDKRVFTLRGNMLTLASISGRKKVLLNIPEYFKKYSDIGVLQQVTIQVSRRGNPSISLVFLIKDPVAVESSGVIGIDRGVHHIAVTSTNKFYSSSKIRAAKRRFLYNKRALQKKGTLSSKRKLRQLSGREMRFVRDVNHCISKKLSLLPATTFVLERLEGITKKKRKHPAKKRLNKRLSDWSFSQLASFLSYKAAGLGKTVAYVDARYTSQKCSNCKQRHDTHRNRSKFRCAGCGHKEHADFNAAKNIRDDYLNSLLPTLSEEQVAVNPPNKETVETASLKFSAKAEKQAQEFIPE